MLGHSSIFQALKTHAQLFSQMHLRGLFSQDKERFLNFSVEWNGFLFDYSKNFMTKETLSLLLSLAQQCQLKDKIEALFTGTKINTTEKRPALHTALRNLEQTVPIVDGINYTDQVRAAYEKMEEIVNQIHQHQWLGFSQKPIQDIVNLGVGGSDLGPAMTTYALLPYHLNKVRCHFVSNIDAADMWETTRHLNPETTLFIICSKSFDTQETLSNAVSAKSWLQKARPDETLDLTNHFIAVTARPEKAKEWGVKHVLPIWDWVGGRFSIWSAMGTSLALAIGMDNFKLFLDGAASVDQHFRTTEFSKNIPVIWGLLNIWYINFFDVRSHAILPYDQYLKLLPAYLQQLEMESNGKYRRHTGEKVSYASSSVIWGMIGSNGQHAVHQLLHQGTHLIPIDFILPLTSHYSLENHHTWLVANCLSQSKALMLGKTSDEVKEELLQQEMSSHEIEQLLPHKVLEGNRPSNTLLFPKLTPYALGALIALYEHKVFVQSVIWDINCFDQWGVELGKQFSKKIFQELCTDSTPQEHDGSTLGLMDYYKKNMR